MTTALLQQALDALKTCETSTYGQAYSEIAVNAAAKDIRAHLTQPQGKPLFADLIAQHDGLAEELAAMDKPQGEPVAWKWKHKSGQTGVYFENPETLGIPIPHPKYEWTPLFTHPAHTEKQVRALTHISRCDETGVLLSNEALVRRILGVPAP